MHHRSLATKKTTPGTVEDTTSTTTTTTSMEMSMDSIGIEEMNGAAASRHPKTAQTGQFASLNTRNSKDFEGVSSEMETFHQVYFHICSDGAGPVVCNWQRRGEGYWFPFEGVGTCAWAERLSVTSLARLGAEMLVPTHHHGPFGSIWSTFWSHVSLDLRRVACRTCFIARGCLPPQLLGGIGV